MSGIHPPPQFFPFHLRRLRRSAPGRAPGAVPSAPSRHRFYPAQPRSSLREPPESPDKKEKHSPVLCYSLFVALDISVSRVREFFYCWSHSFSCKGLTARVPSLHLCSPSTNLCETVVTALSKEVVAEISSLQRQHHVA